MNPIPFIHPNEAVRSLLLVLTQRHNNTDASLPSVQLIISGIGPSIRDFLVGKMKDNCEKEGEEMPEAGEAFVPSSSILAKLRLFYNASNNFYGVNLAHFFPQLVLRDNLLLVRQKRSSYCKRRKMRQTLRKRLDGIELWVCQTHQLFLTKLPTSTETKIEVSLPLQSGRYRQQGLTFHDCGGKVASSLFQRADELTSFRYSGSYAILLSLYQHSSSPSDLRFCVRAEIVDNAAALCDVSFEKGSSMNGGHAEGGPASHFSAWNSMKTLVDKGLVESLNKQPKKWRLTDSGYELANKLAASAKIAQHPQAPSSEEAPDMLGERTWGPGRVLGGNTSASGRHFEPARESRRNQEDLDYQRDLELVLLESRSMSGGSGGVGASTSKRIQEPPASSLAKAISSPFPGDYSNGRKAANGFYANQPANAVACKSSGLDGSGA